MLSAMRQIDQSKKLAVIPRLTRKFHPMRYGEAGRRIAAMWEVPEADRDLWYCGRNLVLSGPAMSRSEAAAMADRIFDSVRLQRGAHTGTM